MTQRDWQKDMDMCEAARETENGLTAFRELGVGGPMMATYWLQEAKMMRDTIEMAMNEYHLWQSGDTAAPMMYGILQEAMSTLYPDTPAPKEGSHEPSEIKRRD